MLKTKVGNTTQTFTIPPTLDTDDVLDTQTLQDPLSPITTEYPTTNEPTQEIPNSPEPEIIPEVDPVAEQMAVWLPSILHVTDPVAFMTSASKSSSGRINLGGGNYDKAIEDRHGADGFYELSKKECQRLSSEIQAFATNNPLNTEQIAQLNNVSAFLLAYGELYTKLQNSGSSNRAALTEAAKSALMNVEVLYASIPSEFFGNGIGQIENAMIEISMFLDSWTTVAAQAANTNASSQMSALFLQTTERSRQILNEYGQLDERGGDNTGTAHMAIKDKKGNWAHTPEEGQEAAATQGGVMAMALRSYGLEANQKEAIVKQMKEMVVRVKAGEFKTEAECVAAFRKHLGGGRASEAFYKQVDEVARGHWKAFLAQTEANLQKSENDKAAQAHKNAEHHLNETSENIGSRDLNAKSFEKNTAFYGQTTNDYEELGKKAANGQIEVVDKSLDPRIHQDNAFKPYPTFQDQMKSGKFNPNGFTGEYDQFGNLVRISGQDTAMVIHQDLSDEYAQLGRATQSKQEQSYLKMDAKSTEEAYKNALYYQNSAKVSAGLAKKELNAGQAHLQSSLQHYLQAQTYITEARVHAAHVSGTHPALLEGLTSLETELLSIEKQLSQDAKIRASLKQAQQTLEATLEKYTKNIQSYNPQMLKVPMPKATVDGVVLESEEFQKLKIDLSGPAWGIFWWLGGLEGSYSTIHSTKADDDNWKKAKIEIYAGIKATVWILEAGVKLKGFFEAQKKDAAGLEDTLSSGGEELGRWAYAWWYDLDSMANDIAGPIDRALDMGMGVYDVLSNASRDGQLLTAELTKAEDQMRLVHQVLANRLVEAFVSKQGNTDMDPQEGVRLASRVMPLDDIITGIQALQGLNEKAPEQIEKEKAGLRSVSDEAKNKAVSDIAKVDPGQNNPNVKFEAGVGIEGFAGVNIGDTKVELGVTRVYSIKDGEGEDFDYSVNKETKIKLAGEFKGGWGIEVSLSPTSKGWTGGLEVTIPVAAQEHVDGSGVLASVRNALTGVKATDVEAWANRVKGIIEKDVPWDKFFEAKIGSAVEIKVGGELKLNDDLEVQSGSVSFALSTKLEAGDKFAKVSYTQGNMVTLKFGG